MNNYVKTIGATAILATVAAYGMTPNDETKKQSTMEFISLLSVDSEILNSNGLKVLADAKNIVQDGNTKLRAIIKEKQAQNKSINFDEIISSLDKPYKVVVSDCVFLTGQKKVHEAMGITPFARLTIWDFPQKESATFYKNACPEDIYIKY